MLDIHRCSTAGAWFSRGAQQISELIFCMFYMFKSPRRCFACRSFGRQRILLFRLRVHVVTKSVCMIRYDETETIMHTPIGYRTRRNQTLSIGSTSDLKIRWLRWPKRTYALLSYVDSCVLSFVNTRGHKNAIRHVLLASQTCYRLTAYGKKT